MIAGGSNRLQDIKRFIFRNFFRKNAVKKLELELLIRKNNLFFDPEGEKSLEERE